MLLGPWKTPPDSLYNLKGGGKDNRIGKGGGTYSERYM